MSAEPLALDVIRDPVSDLGGRLDRFAGAHAARFAHPTFEPERPSLLRDLAHRWQPSVAGTGMIQVFDAHDFAGLVNHWGQRGGYEGDAYDYEGPFVIPVDPVEHVQGLTGQQMRRRPARRQALRPVSTRPQRATPRPAARERWRAIESSTATPRYSAYPAAMGNAGAIESTLLRFPTAQAQIGTADVRDVVIDAASGGQLWQPQSLTPAARAAERMDADVGARLAPAPAQTVETWLVPMPPAGSPQGRAPGSASGDRALPALARQTGPRLDARVPLFARRADALAETPRTPWRDAPVAGPLVALPDVEPSVADRSMDPRITSRTEASSEGMDSRGVPTDQGPSIQPDTVGPALAPRRALARSPRLPRQAARRSARRRTPWQAPTSAPPGVIPFVPAALARLAQQIGQTARASQASDAPWPWASSPLETGAPARSGGAARPDFAFAQRMDDGALVAPSAAVSPPTGDATARSARPTTRPTSTGEGTPARPPGAAASVPVAPAPRSLDGDLAASTAALSALLADIADPIEAIARTRPAGTTLAQWRERIAAQPALTRQLSLLDQLSDRVQVGLPRAATDARSARPPALHGALDSPALVQPAPALSIEPIVESAVGPTAAGSTAATSTTAMVSTGLTAADAVRNGMAILTGAPASATLFGSAWQAAPSLARPVLGAAGMGPGDAARPGPAFSIGERIAAVSAHLAARHGLSVEAAPGGALDAGWYREPTGTLVVPMAPAVDVAAQVTGRLVSRRGDIQTSAKPAQAALDRPPAPRIAGASIGMPALRSALAAQRGATPMRPVPQIPSVFNGVAPAALNTWSELANTPPALVEVLGRAITLDAPAETLATDRSPEQSADVTISRLARMGDLPALVALARMADAPEITTLLEGADTQAPVLRALARGIAVERPFADAPALDAPLIELTAETTPDDPAPPRATLREVQARLASVLPAAVRAAMAAQPARSLQPASRAFEATQRTAAVESQAAAIAQRTTITRTAITDGASARAGEAIQGRDPRAAQRVPHADGSTRPSALVAAAPDPVQIATASMGDAATVQAALREAQSGAPRALQPAMGDITPSVIAQAIFGPIGRTAQRAVRWAQLAIASRPQAFEALAAQHDAAQSPIARRVLAPTTPLDSVHVDTSARVHATPVGELGRRSAAFVAQVDGRHAAAAPAGVRPIWSPSNAFDLDGALVQPSAATDSPAARSLGASSAEPRIGRTDPAPSGPVPTNRASNPLAAGLAGGRFRWPQAPLRWVEIALTDHAAQQAPRMGATAARPSSPRPDSPRPSSAPGRSGLRSLALSDRVLNRGLDGLGVMLQRTDQRQTATHPLGALNTATPKVQLDLGLPAEDAPLVAAEAFANSAQPRQTATTSPDAPSQSRVVPRLNVDWVQPVTAVADDSASLAPRLQAPGNVRQAIDVWVDAVRTEAERSPSAAREAMGSIGQLIQQFSAPGASHTTVRPSSVLRGALFTGGGHAAPVTIEPPADGEARPALIRPGEHAARQALRKGTDTVQVSQASTTEEARHKNAEQTDELLPPEEVERLATEVIDRIKRELEFDAARTGEDGWD